MKQYYLMMAGDTEQDAWLETNLLGEDNGFGVFWSGQALSTLMRLVEMNPIGLETAEVKTDKNETLTISEFLDDIKGLKIRYDRT